ncbi:unnamed protein product [Acanthosepion pharaonis]|uniref:Uncharacterized protein n=1 Tax=Acanthosepion pharaonis TaxID=158019 RepID=A0A812BUF5_ACAPH|nr:unnamed protein product [Sepia pharaonis]
MHVFLPVYSILILCLSSHRLYRFIHTYSFFLSISYSLFAFLLIDFAVSFIHILSSFLFHNLFCLSSHRLYRFIHTYSFFLSIPYTFFAFPLTDFTVSFIHILSSFLFHNLFCLSSHRLYRFIQTYPFYLSILYTSFAFLLIAGSSIHILSAYLFHILSFPSLSYSCPVLSYTFILPIYSIPFLYLSSHNLCLFFHTHSFYLSIPYSSFVFLLIVIAGSSIHFLSACLFHTLSLSFL